MEFNQLQEYQQEIISNGCGPAISSVRPPNAKLFKEVCDQHDLDYYLGFREIHRIKADLRLRRGIRDKIDILPIPYLRMHMLPIFRNVPDYMVKLLFRRWADIYFTAVFLFGRHFFYYGEKQQELP